MKPYIMKLSPALKDIIWGGHRLSDEYGKGEAGQKIAESWELALHKDGVCRAANGEYEGKGLDEILGTTEFPTLIKLIDACDNLSIQVHPAKTEMWYIVDCDEGAALVYGLKDKFNEASFREALKNGTVESLLNYVPVHKGDIFFIPTGLVHAIGKGILIAEIQQNSNITYRVYDYNRLQNGKPRELHVEQAISVIRDFTEEDINAIRYSKKEKEPGMLASCDYFTTYRYDIRGAVTRAAEDSFECVMCLEGEGFCGNVPMKKGDTCFVPAGYGSYSVSSEKGMNLIVTTI